VPGKDYAFAPDQVGKERIRAILFSTRERAAALLEKLPKPDSNGMISVTPDKLKRDLRLVSTIRPAVTEFYTSDIIFEVVDKGVAPNVPDGLAPRKELQ